jgi:septal ring factor EnvC (AmiA/AmiB activator)
MAIPQPGDQKQGNPQLSELQKQLNEQISELKKSGKTGRELSEELARLAAEQEKLRRMLQEEEKKLNQKNGKEGSMGDITEKMEETEIDLVNKKLTQQLIQRQQEILTRLLEAEDAMREQELDPEREAKTAREIQREIPPEFEKYLKTKEKEIELLRTLPPRLNPYYKKEVMEYFNRLEKTFK